MKLFKKQNIHSKISTTLEEAIELLLTSIASQEDSLSKLLEAEKERVLFFLNEEKLHNFSAQDIKDINQSVNNTINNIIRFQILLDNRVHNIMDLLPSTTNSNTNKKNKKNKKH